MKSNRVVWRSIAAMFALFTAIGVVRADYYDGLRAFDKKDYTAALREWKASANAGDAKSQYRLGRLYEAGRGVPQSYVQAHLYFNLAAAKGHDEARKAREALTSKMSKAELGKARELAAAWKPRKAGKVAAPKPSKASRPDPNEALIKAVAAGDASAVKAALKAGAKADIKDDDGWTPLLFASIAGKTEVVKALLEGGGDPNAQAKDGATPLLVAIVKKHEAVVKALVEGGADTNAKARDGTTPLMAAARTGSVAIVKALLDHAANANAKRTDGATALLTVAGKGDAAMAKALLAGGADANLKGPQGITPLMVAAREGHLELVKALIKAGADPAAKSNSGVTALAAADSLKQTAVAKVLLGYLRDGVFEAVSRGYTSSVKRWIERKGPVNRKNEAGWTPLLLAAAENKTAIALLLIEAKANVNAADKNGNTPLMAAALHGNEALVKALIKAKANRNLRNKAGLTAYAIARQKKRTNVVALLRPRPSKQALAKAARRRAQLERRRQAEVMRRRREKARRQKLAKLPYTLTIINGCHRVNTAYVAYRYRGRDGRWVTRGWIPVNRGSNAHRRLLTRNRIIYLYASSGRLKWRARGQPGAILRWVQTQSFTHSTGRLYGTGARQVWFYKKMFPPNSKVFRWRLTCQN